MNKKSLFHLQAHGDKVRVLPDRNSVKSLRLIRFKTNSFENYFRNTFCQMQNVKECRPTRTAEPMRNV